MNGYFPPGFGDLAGIKISDGLYKVAIAVPIDEWERFESSELHERLRKKRGFEVTPFYSDNEIYCQEVVFYEKCGRWSEIGETPDCREVMRYLAELKIRYKPDQRSEVGQESGNRQKCENSKILEYLKSSWARVRTWFLER